MELFGFSAAKIIVILIIAIVILGPEKVPQLATQAGKLIRDFRRYMKEMTKEFDDVTGDLRAEFTAITTDLRDEVAAAQADLQSQLDLTAILHGAEPPSTETFTAPTMTPQVAMPAESATLVIQHELTAPPDPSIAKSAPLSPETVSVIAPTSTDTVVPVRARKADPLADLVVLKSGSSTTNGPHGNGHHTGNDVGEAEERGDAHHTVPIEPHSIIGRSVMATMYLRRGRSVAAHFISAPLHSSCIEDSTRTHPLTRACRSRGSECPDRCNEGK